MVLTGYDRDPAIDLCGEWEFTTDPRDVGANERWAEGNWPRDTRSVTVPHAWQELDDLRGYAGVGWYRRTFDGVNLDPGERALLSFGAVDYEATVWVNGTRLGSHADGYLPFSFDVTDALLDGTNEVVLRVYDPEDLSEIPHGKQGERWYTRVSGPWQRVDLLVVPETHVENLRITPDLSRDVARVDVSIDGPTLADASAICAVEQDGDTIAEVTVPVDGNVATAEVSVPDAEYWTPDSPTLYEVTVALARDDGTVVDSFEDSFGMRSVEVEDGDLLLNGEPLYVRGALDQAYYPDTLYRPTDESFYAEEIRLAKELGFNLLRKHIKPAHPAFLEHADRLGMLVWEEPANPKRYTDTSRARVRYQLYGTIDRDYNSPSVIAVSLYNEEWGIGGADEEEPLWTDVEKQSFLEELYHEVREYDPTRLVCDNSGWAHVATDLNDYHEYFVVPDRVGPWRDRLDRIIEEPGDNYGAERTDPERAPILVSEFGTWGFPSVSALEEHYGGDPPWFDHGFLSGLKRPAGVRERFENGPLADAFEDVEDLAAVWQRREFESVETLVADMRERDAISGYCITEFSDIEWEFNGVLDYLRGEKAFHDAFAALNAPVMVHVDADRRAVRSGDRVAFDVVAANDTGVAVERTVEWAVNGDVDSDDLAGTVDVFLAPHESVRLGEAVEFEAPPVAAGETATVAVTVEVEEEARSIPLTVLSGETTARLESPVFVDEPDLAARMEEAGYAIVADRADADVLVLTNGSDVASRASDDVVSTVEEGAHAVVLPGPDGHVAETELFEYESLATEDSWNLCASFVWQTLIEEESRLPGWLFRDIYPYHYVAAIEKGDRIEVGYTEGWLANTGGIVLRRALGEGSLNACTLRVTAAYGENPGATLVLDRLLSSLE